MIGPLVDTLRAAAPDTSGISDVQRLVIGITPLVHGIGVAGELPCGRYVIHEEPAFNLQLDVFSPGYTGGIHLHGTWGIMAVLRGGLWVEDYDNDRQLTRFAWLGAGGVQGFAPPASDWHRVSTAAAGPQTVSFHIYGRGFDLDEGVGVGPDGVPRTYRRGPVGDALLARAALRPA